MPVLDMKPYIEKEILDLSNDVNNLKEKGFLLPTLYIITDGVDDRCKTYMKSKLIHGEKVGINVVVKTIQTVDELDELLETAFRKNIPTIMQLPIKKELEESYNNNSLSKILDVDGFFSYNELVNRDWDNAPCTPKGVMNFILDSNGLDLDVRGKLVVLMGYGALTNKPLSIMLCTSGSTCVNVNTSTNIFLKKQVLKQADIVICSTGVKGSVKTSWLSDEKTVYVFNVGTIINKEGKLETELEDDAQKNNIFYTPRIGGVGVLTVLSLMENVVSFYRRVCLDKKN